MVIKGYADWKGSESFNMRLSKLRAKKVETYLRRLCKKRGKKDVHFKTEWFGYKKLVINRKGPMAPNRRVEIYVLQ